MDSEQQSVLVKRILERMDQLGISQAEVARRGRFNRAFVSDLLRGKKQSIHDSNYVRLARALLTTPLYLRTGSTPSAQEMASIEDEWKFAGTRPNSEPSPTDISDDDYDAMSAAFGHQTAPSKPRTSRNTVPAFRAGGRHDGAALLTDPAKDQLPSPPMRLLESLYAIAVSDDTMAPRYEPGDFVYARLDKNAPWQLSVRPKDYVAVRAQGRVQKKPVTLAFVRQLLRVTDDEVIVRQFKPSIETSWPRSSIIGIDRIVLAGDAFGDTLI